MPKVKAAAVSRHLAAPLETVAVAIDEVAGKMQADLDGLEPVDRAARP